MVHDRRIRSLNKTPYLRGIFFFLLLLAMASYVSASSDWLEASKYNTRAGFQDPTYVSQNMTGNIISSIGTGFNMQPLVGDYDNDGVTEIIAATGNFIQIYQVISDTLTLEDEYNMGTPLISQPWSGNIDGDAFIEIVAATATRVWTFDYNDTAFNYSVNASVGGVITGIACANFSGTWGCYFANSTNNIYEYNPNTAGLTAYPQSFNISLSLPLWVTPLNDYDNDGDVEMFFPWRAATNYGFCVVDQSTMANDTTFSSDGCWQDGTVISEQPSYIMTYNLDGGGSSEICLAYLANAATVGASYLKCFKSDGSAYGSRQEITTTENTKTPTISNPIMVLVNGSYRDVCIIASDSGTLGSTASVRCYKVSAGTLTQSFAYGGHGIGIVNNQYWQNGMISAADMDNDGWEDIIASNAILIRNSTGSFSFINLTSNSYNYNSMVADVNDDDILETCHEYTSFIGCSFSSFSDGIPTLTDTFGRSYANPVCNGTKLRFYAHEYDESGAQPAETNYYNDIDTDTERLNIDCYGNGTLYNGNYSLAAPYQDCTYNALGTYYARVYLQDQYNPTDITQYDDVIVLVVSGTPGITCNVEPVPISVTPINGTVPPIPDPNPTNEGVKSFLDWFTGGDDDSKLFIGFLLWVIIIIVVGAFMASVTHSGTAVAVIAGLAGIVGFVVLAALGMFPLWLLILVFLFLALSTALYLGVMKGGG